MEDHVKITWAEWKMVQKFMSYEIEYNDMDYVTLSWRQIMQMVRKIHNTITNPEPPKAIEDRLDELSHSLMRADIDGACAILLNLIQWSQSLPF